MNSESSSVPTRGPRTRRMRVIASLSAVAASALLLSACGSDDDSTSTATVSASMTPSPSPTGSPSSSPSGSSSSTGPLTEDQNERKALVSAAKVGWEKAADTAVAEVAGSKLADIELKGADRGADPLTHPQWVAKVAPADGTAHNVRIDAVSGKVIQSATEADQDADDKRELADRLKRAERTPQQAAKTATDKRKGTVSSIELDDDDSRTLIWSVDVVTSDDWNKTTFDTNAASGKIEREKVDND